MTDVTPAPADPVATDEGGRSRPSLRLDRRTTLHALAATRVALGTAFVLAPGLMGNLFAGPGNDRAWAKVLGRALGVRDLALGLGLLRALRKHEDPSTWALYGAVSDAVDAAAIALAWRQLGTPLKLPVVSAASTAAAVGALAALAKD